MHDTNQQPPFMLKNNEDLRLCSITNLLSTLHFLPVSFTHQKKNVPVALSLSHS